MKKFYEFSEDFSQVCLEDSYILDIRQTETFLEIDMDLVLTEAHTFYETSILNEQYCFRRGKIIFDNITDIRWENKQLIGYPDLTGEIDYGNIDSLVFENDEYILEGNIGKIVISSSPPEVIVYKKNGS